MKIDFDFGIADLILIATLLILIWQTWLLRKDIKANAIRDLYSKWNEVSKMEVKCPKFHKMLMSEKYYYELKDLTEEELKERALAHMVLDVFSMIYHEEKSKILESNEPYIKEVMANPIMKKCWIDYHLRETWDGYEFQEYIDNTYVID